MGRSPCCSKIGLKRGPWSTKEDTLLTNYIQQHGEGQWRSLPKNAGLLRCGKSCRLRWMNYLRPGIKRGNITEDEEDLIVRLHGLLGNRWSLIAGRIPGRTDNEIKNYWNTHLLKKLQSAGINPNPYKAIPKTPKIKNINQDDSSTVSGKKKKKKNKQSQLVKSDAAAAAASMEVEEEEEKVSVDPPKMKVYLPKPIRVSSVFSRTNSYDSLASGSSSSSDGGVGEEKVAEVGWPSPLFELTEDDFLGMGCILPMSGDVNMWETVYDEYLQLL